MGREGGVGGRERRWWWVNSCRVGVGGAVGYNTANDSMAYDSRFATGLQIPYQPLAESTRLQIERSLFSLEEKLRRRREIDRELMEEVPLYQPNYLEQLRLQEDARLGELRRQEEVYQLQLDEAEHQAKLDRLRAERDMVKLDREVGYIRAAAYGRKEYGEVEVGGEVGLAEDEDLVKKYENGSKAKEYYDDLQNQIARKRQWEEQEELARERMREQAAKDQQERERQVRELMREQREKQENERPQDNERTKDKEIYETERKDKMAGWLHSKQKETLATPYDLINDHRDVQPKIAQKSRLAQQLQKEFDRIEQDRKQSRSVARLPVVPEERNKSPIRQTDSRSKSPLRHLDSQTNQASPFRSMTKYKSLSRLPRNLSRSGLSPHRTSRLSDDPKPATDLKELQALALKKIQTRLKLSQVIYEDSQFRNIKYECNHLFNTFEQESRQRREIREKLNSHPYVLRKHSLVVE